MQQTRTKNWILYTYKDQNAHFLTQSFASRASKTMHVQIEKLG